MRLTSTGQITIPRHVCERLGIAPGSEVEFELDEDGARLVPAGGAGVPHPDRGTRRSCTVAMSAEEIPALTSPHD